MGVAIPVPVFPHHVHIVLGGVLPYGLLFRHVRTSLESFIGARNKRMCKGCARIFASDARYYCTSTM